MKRYEVLLVRSYLVTIDAQDKVQAMNLTELFLGNCPDLSTPADQGNENFMIHDVKMTFNEAIESCEISVGMQNE